MKITSRYIASQVELPEPFAHHFPPGSLPKAWIVFELGTSGRVPVAWAVNKIAAVNIAGALQALTIPGQDADKELEQHG